MYSAPVFVVVLILWIMRCYVRKEWGWFFFFIFVLLLPVGFIVLFASELTREDICEKGLAKEYPSFIVNLYSCAKDIERAEQTESEIIEKKDNSFDDCLRYADGWYISQWDSRCGYYGKKKNCTLLGGQVEDIEREYRKLKRECHVKWKIEERQTLNDCKQVAYDKYNEDYSKKCHECTGRASSIEYQDCLQRHGSGCWLTEVEEDSLNGQYNKDLRSCESKFRN